MKETITTPLKEVPNKHFLKELKNRIVEKKIDKEDLFQVLESQEVVAECEVADFSKLTPKDWKKAYQDLEKDKNYQKEVRLWEAIDDE